MDGGEIIQWLGCFGTPAFLVFGDREQEWFGSKHEKLIPGASDKKKYFF